MLTLPALRLGLHDLLTKRKPDLNLSKAGQFYEPQLVEQLVAIDALPPAFTGRTPLAADIDALDADHDGYGGAIFFTTEVYLRLPGVDPTIIEAAKRVRAAFIPELRELGATYVVEAERAMDRKPLLASMKADLDLFPVAGGGTLHAVATAFVDKGIAIHHMLSQRADVPKGARGEAARVRSATVGVLGRLRAELVREVKIDKTLPRDLEAKVFGYFDTLSAMKEPATEKPEPPAPPADPPKP